MQNKIQLKKYLQSATKPKYTIGQLSSKPLHEVVINNCKLQIIKNDITAEKVDAIVNAANNFLSHGGGVALAISRKGGRKIQDESDEIIRKYNKVQNGESVITSPGKLPCKFVIHTVGPIWNGVFHILQFCL